MGLIHPRNLGDWQRWQSRRHPARRVRGVFAPAERLRILRGGPDADLVVALDAAHTSVRAALLDPLAHLPLERVAILSSAGTSRVVEALLPLHDWTAEDLVPEQVEAALATASAVIGSGHYTRVGGLAYSTAVRMNLRFAVVQHGLLTPWAPPLPMGARLLAWSDADAEFWAGERDDVSRQVVGSALLTRAVGLTRRVVDPAGQPVYLGQLHAAELRRSELARAAEQFCRSHGATYRPHPSEQDRASRRHHDRWSRAGVLVDGSRRDVLQLNRPIVSVFSTGVLEAAAAGIPAWVDFPEPPPWLTELWGRYRMSRYGEPPTTPRPARADPAGAVAAWLMGDAPCAKVKDG